MEMIQTKKKTTTHHLWASYLLFAISSGIIITLLALLVGAWLFQNAQIPVWAYVPVAVVAVCLGSFASGFILAKQTKRNGIFGGLCCGILFFCLYLVASMMNGDFSYTALSGIKLVTYSLSGCIGGLLGIAFSEQKKQIKR